ncbi:MAG: Gfo/Idh/MocA family oxidoreductase [bacterium]|nr:Gfo/Idh/MocA family oxidoreductase [bacterium]
MPVPLVIVGGGRWGRTWLSVAMAARGSTDGIVLAARSRPEEVRAWAAARADLAGLAVVSSLTEAMAADRRPQAAIISSRPRDHVRDGMEALSHGLHLLVEKPLSVDCDSGRSLVAAAAQAKRVLAVGTEFAFLPAFHQIAAELAASGTADVSIVWDDIESEERYGAVKVRHDETGLIHDLLPHVFSILRIFVPGGKLAVSVARESPDARRGYLVFGDSGGGRHECRFDAAASTRRRLVEIRTDFGHAAVDFGSVHASMTVDGKPRLPEPATASMVSTLRLELGALLTLASGATDAAFAWSAASDLLDAQAELERVLEIRQP